MIELWSDIQGYEGFYKISSLGRVAGIRKKLLNPALNSHGYPVVNLYRDGCRKTATVHRLVAKHFLDVVTGSDFVNHIDGVKSNCAATNLEWCDAKHNSKHAIENRLMVHKFGSEHHAAKLTAEQVIAIRKKSGETLSAIANEYGVSRSLICMIRKGHLWNREEFKLNTPQ